MPSCPANSRETLIGAGFKAQTTLETPNTAAEIWSFLLTNTAPVTVQPNTEDDANDIGKGDEFPTQLFPLGIDVTARFEKQVSSEFAAWAFSFGLGGVTKTAAGTGWKYDAKPTDPLVACINCPPFTVVEQIRPAGAPPFLDRALVGCIISGFTLSLESGPSRNNARISVDCVGTGKIISPSTIIIPPPTQEHFLNAASATLTINGIDYVLTKTFISAEISWGVTPRLDEGYYPGSGVDANGYALRGRMEYSSRVAGMTFVARAQAGSPEYNMLMNRQEGTTIITLTGAVIGAGPEKHSIRIEFPRSTISAATNGDANGLVTINGAVKPLKHSTLGYVTFSATTSMNSIVPVLDEDQPEIEAAFDQDRNRDRDQQQAA